MKFNELTEEENRVINEKGTEPAFSGEYDKTTEKGIYTCRKCNAPLYRSESKFDSGCGWPSFDDEIFGAINKQLDKDGMRNEIVCRRCLGHLGHVFEGEKLTDKNIRHCVNSVSMKLVGEDEIPNSETIYLGGGCFWCLEAVLKLLNGVTGVTSGYSGGETESPDYDSVCGGQTGHAEIVEVKFNPKEISLEKILEVFFESHDPTTLNKQGNDVGIQYRSIILHTSENQKEIVDNYVERIKDKYDKEIVTEIVSLEKFYPAEDYHQDYFEKNPSQRYCQLVVAPKVDKIKNKLK
jgi:peptide methionine sulfoxide reductase msrA/msrB